MVELVLETARLEPARTHHPPPTVRSKALDCDVTRPAHVRRQIRDAEAPLAADFFALGMYEHRVDQLDQPVIARVLRMTVHIDDEDAEELPDLRRGEADAEVVGLHRLDEIGNHPQRVAHLSRTERPARLLQRGMREDENLTDRHAGYSVAGSRARTCTSTDCSSATRARTRSGSTPSGAATSRIIR